jgi:hypothetical protein
MMIKMRLLKSRRVRIPNYCANYEGIRILRLFHHYYHNYIIQLQRKNIVEYDSIVAESLWRYYNIKVEIRLQMNATW